MTSSATELSVAAWKFTSEEPLVMTRFCMSRDAHARLVDWTRVKSGRQEEAVTVILRGLHEILAWYVPDAVYLKNEGQPGGGKRICAYFCGDVRADLQCRVRVQAAISTWLGIVYNSLASSHQREVASSALDDVCWSLVEIPTELRSAGLGACGAPQNPFLWDALTAHAASRLAGQSIVFRSGQSSVLVPTVAQAGPFSGIELVAFPPRRQFHGDGWWTEIVTVTAASLPERQGLFILARPSIRNWGQIRSASRANDNFRSLDVFIPALAGDGERAPWRHGNFDFQAKRATDGDGKPVLTGHWRHGDEERVFALLRRLNGLKGLDDGDLLKPISDRGGLWVLPRLATGHGDRFLPGGVGVPWPDRKDIADSVGRCLSAGAFEQISPLRRVSVRAKDAPDAPFSTPAKPEQEELFLQRRTSVREALRMAGRTDGVLEFFVFALLDNTQELVRSALSDLLGVPKKSSDGQMEWADGLALRFRIAHPQTMAEPLEYFDPSLHGAKATRADHYEVIAKRMAEEIRCAREGGTGIACAILEMPALRRENVWIDPFAMARRELARQGILPQVVLVEDELADDKYKSAVRDCLRMLGVVPTSVIRESDHAPSAITVVQRNRTVVGGGFIETQALPLAARSRGHALEVALPDAQGLPQWMPYAQAARKVFSGEYERFGRKKTDDNKVRFHEFFAAALTDIDRWGPALVIAEMETSASWIDSLSNGRLVWDQIELSNRVLSPQELPNVRLIRASPDPRKQPHYYQDVESAEVKWPSGLFAWQDAKRTYYALKSKPPTLGRSVKAPITSRHGGGESEGFIDQVNRLSSQLDEFCVVFQQREDSALRLAYLATRWRAVHAQYKFHTTLPFPLHELQLLGDAITA